LKQQWQAMCYAFRPNGASPEPELTEELANVEQSQFWEGIVEEVDLQDYVNLESAGYLSGGSCPAAETVSVLGSAFTIEYTPFCQAAEWIGYLVMIMAGFAAFRIVAGGFG
jgi:hypothetical protein